MSLKPLINKQTIIIDDHKRGVGEVKNWDDPAADIHIDKTTKYPIDGKKQAVRIRIPINSNRPIRVETAKVKKQSEVPNQLKREIIKAFSNRNTRGRFIADVLDILKDFESKSSNEDKARETLEKLSGHFDLEWTGDTIKTFVKDALDTYTETYIDEKGELYYITIDKKKIKLADLDSRAKQEISFKGKLN